MRSDLEIFKLFYIGNIHDMSELTRLYFTRPACICTCKCKLYVSNPMYT